MAHYLVQLAYTPEAWGAMANRPQNRLDAVQPVAERLGGRILSKWMAFGEHDVVAILEMPDNVSAAAFSVAVSAGGAVRSMKTTPLLSMEDGVEVMKRAGGARYRSPLG
ncbi:MAG: GYD domain-containing protein [Candidatus Rokuibacteriota bacterium]